MKSAGDYRFQTRELSGSQRLLRLEDLAQHLHRVVLDAGGHIDREEAFSSIASRLGTSEEEVRQAVAPSMRSGLITRSADGQRFELAVAGS